MRLDRLTEEQQTAFKTEMKVVRRALKAIKQARQQQRRPDLAALQAQLATCRSALDRWQRVLVVGYHVRPPVRLWDSWHRLDIMAELNATELERRKAQAA